jgi:predicted small lipoprotein YifL
MKKFLSLFLVTASMATVLTACGQDKPSPAAKATGKAAGATITIDYSQPAVKGRKVWGDLVPYGMVWRTGANEATVFETDSDIKIEGQSLPKGKYGLFSIPGENEWTIIFNKTWNQWGSFRYKQEEDVLRVKVKPTSNDMNERLTFTINGDKVTLLWDKLAVGFKVSK